MLLRLTVAATNARLAGDLAADINDRACVG